MIRKIAISTGGGDATGLNAVIRAVVRNVRDYYRWDVVEAAEKLGISLGR